MVWVRDEEAELGCIVSVKRTLNPSAFQEFGHPMLQTIWGWSLPVHTRLFTMD